MSHPRPADVLGRVTLLTGPEEFLNERTLVSVREAVRAHDPEAETSEALGGDLTLASLGELSAPSLFSSTRCVVVRELENLPDESVNGLLDYCAAPVDDIALVLAHSGGQKGSGVLAKLRKLATVTEVKSEALKASEFAGFVVNELRRHGAKIDTRRPTSWSAPSARTSARSRLPQTSWPPTSRESRSGSSRSSATSADVPRPSPSPWPTTRSTAVPARRSRSSAGPSTAAPQPCW